LLSLTEEEPIYRTLTHEYFSRDISQSNNKDHQTPYLIPKSYSDTFEFLTTKGSSPTTTSTSAYHHHNRFRSYKQKRSKNTNRLHSKNNNKKFSSSYNNYSDSFSSSPRLYDEAWKALQEINDVSEIGKSPETELVLFRINENRIPYLGKNQNKSMILSSVSTSRKSRSIFSKKILSMIINEVVMKNYAGMENFLMKAPMNRKIMSLN